MSLGRLALRLAAIEALRPHAALTSGVWPTIARQRVFGSLAAPIDDLAADERAPVIVVYTDAHDGKSLASSGGPPIPREVALVFEISIVQLGEDPESPGAYFVGEPVTDEEAEASLDLLEAQIEYVLLYAASGRPWRSLTGRRVHSISSTPQRTAEEAIRLATRKITWDVSIPPDCFDLAALAAPSGLDRLPEPFRSLAAELPAFSEVLRLATAIAAGAPVPPVLPRLNSLGMTVDAHTDTPTQDQDVVADLTIPQPD